MVTLASSNLVVNAANVFVRHSQMLTYLPSTSNLNSTYYAADPLSLNRSQYYETLASVFYE